MPFLSYRGCNYCSSSADRLPDDIRDALDDEGDEEDFEELDVRAAFTVCSRLLWFVQCFGECSVMFP